ncbi:hypothetical protein ICHIAU1_14560 [Fluviibacter phosphoraccumulans]|uniref:Uncharacterized protein n=1 Tax=Fluviibacter phosphoraccumulans TaxID=1751046 RepID=A0A7R6TQB1_9RHOO|nr:hypothetical protein ICHIAU1_14560 [Fluviibacter phosphoraccumulans]
MRNEPAELMVFALPRLLSAIEVDNTIEIKDKSAIVPIARPSLASSESLIERFGFVEKIMF